MGRARDMRLLEDQRKIHQLADKVGYFCVSDKRGLPPTEYLLEFCLRGYINKQGIIADTHAVRLSFPERYPFSAPPKFSILKGLFHPNVYKNGDVCHGWFLNNWHPAIHIDDLILDVAKMICFKADSYNLKSPANYDCDKDWIEAQKIPLDETPLEPQEDALTYEEIQVADSKINRPETHRRLQKIRVKVKSDKPSFISSFENKIPSNPTPKPIKIRLKNGKKF